MNSSCRVFAFLLVPLVLFGCVTIPRVELDDYLRNSKVVRETARDTYLVAANDAELIAKHPANADDATKRAAKLTERKRALEVRLKALDLIREYDSILSKLAQGTKPEDVQSSLESLSSNLESFKIDAIADVASAAGPYVAIIAKGIALIDREIQKKRFAEAVAAAQEPMAGILDILMKDADDLGAIRITLLNMKRDKNHRAAIINLGFEIQAFTDNRSNKVPAGGASLPSMGKLHDRHVAARDRYLYTDPKAADPDLPALSRRDVTADADPTLAELGAARSLVELVEAHVADANAIRNAMQRHTEFVYEYRKTLALMKVAFKKVHAAIEKGSAAADAGDLVRQVLELRQAYLSVERGE